MVVFYLHKYQYNHLVHKWAPITKHEGHAKSHEHSKITQIYAVCSRTLDAISVATSVLSRMNSFGTCAPLVFLKSTVTKLLSVMNHFANMLWLHCLWRKTTQLQAFMGDSCVEMPAWAPEGEWDTLKMEMWASAISHIVVEWEVSQVNAVSRNFMHWSKRTRGRQQNYCIAQQRTPYCTGADSNSGT